MELNGVLLSIILGLMSFIWTPSAGYGYPTTLAKGYKTCGTCHISRSGGQLLNEYGRAMSSDFMSTFSVEGEGEEFFGENKMIDYGMDYRHLFVQTFRDGMVNFPMLLDFDGAVHLGNITVASSIGVYSREKNVESRENWLQINLPFNVQARAGYFMKVLGINTNDHNLYIKRNAGLGRGSESYNLEFNHLTKWTQIYYTVGVPSFKLTSYDQNFYHLSYPSRSQQHFVRASFFLDRSEIGANFVYSDTQTIYGMFLKTSPVKNVYGFFEYDRSSDSRQIFARVGAFPIRGFDTYIELDQGENAYFSDRNVYLGIDWMVRPRFELSLKINLSQDKPSYLQNHFWL